MRKLYIFGLIGLAALIIGLAWAEQITLSTYYPAPYGVYKEFKTTSKTTLATNTLGTGVGEDPNAKVGIGTTNPRTKLEIYRALSGTNGLTLTTGDTTGIYNASFISWYAPNATTDQLYSMRFKGDGGLYFGTGDAGGFSQQVVIEASSGNVGIGTTSPDRTLDVNGGAAFRGNHLYLCNPLSDLGEPNWGMVVNEENAFFNLGRAPDPLPGGGELLTSVFNIAPFAPENSLWIANDGKVHMPHGYVADYVFEPEYNLKSFSELREYIRANKRLPGMSKEEGNDGSVNYLLGKLTEKTEEQALYILQLEERLSRLESKL